MLKDGVLTGAPLGFPSSSGAGVTETVVGTLGIVNVGTNINADLAPTYGIAASTFCEGNDTRLSDARIPLAHAVTHENGGTDEISVVGLSGLLADAQTPIVHAATHSDGGTDQITVEDLATAAVDTNFALKPNGLGGLIFGAVTAVAAVPTGNVVWVDAVNGNDGTGTSGQQDLPFLTVAAAILVSVSGDVINVRPGVYPESGLTMMAGTVINGDSWQTTSIGLAAAVTDIITMNVDCGINNLTVIVPTAAHSGISHTAGTGSVTGVNVQGDGVAGVGDGIRKTGTGKLIGGLIRCETGGLNSYVRVGPGVLALDDVHCPQSAGAIASVVLAESTGVWQCQGLNVGNTNVVDAIRLAGTATIRVYSPNLFNVSNAVHLTSDGPNVTIIGGKISAVLRTVWVDPALTGTGSTVRCLGTVLDPLFDFPPAAAANTEFVLEFNQQETNTRDSRQRLIGADLALGFPEVGSAAWIGRGAPYSEGISVYTSDGTETMTGSVVTGGNQTDVTAAAESRTASTFAFQGLTTNNAIYFGSVRKDAALVPLKHWGLKFDQVAAGVGGTYALEIWDGAAWVEIGAMAVSVDDGYRYSNALFLRAGSLETIHLGIDGSTTWAQSTVGGIASYHTRIRILTTVTTPPTWERARLVESAVFFNRTGQRSANGLSKWRSTLVSAGNIFGETGNVVSYDQAVGSGGVPTGWTHNSPNSLMNTSGDAIYTQFSLPSGICTAFPLSINVIFSFQPGGAPITPAVIGFVSAIPVQTAFNDVADPSGGLVPIPRAIVDTETTTAKAGTSFTFTSTDFGTSWPANTLFKGSFGPYDISSYYQDDVVFVRLELDDDGTPNQDVGIVALIVEGVQFTDGGTL